MTFADKVQAPPQPLSVARNIADPALANVAVTLSNPGLLHRLVDPDAGDTLLVVTAPPPVRGFIKRQDFVDFSLLDSAHGVAIRPNSDDVAVEPAGSKIIIGKPGGLTLSPVDVSRRARADRGASAVRHRGVAQEPDREFPGARIRADPGRWRAPSPTSVRRRGSISPASTWRAACIRKPRA